MKTFLRYAWPVLAVIAFQVLIVTILPAKSGWAPYRLLIFGGVDLALGGLQYWQFRVNRRFKREMEQLRRDILERIQ